MQRNAKFSAARIALSDICTARHMLHHYYYEMDMIARARWLTRRPNMFTSLLFFLYEEPNKSSFCQRLLPFSNEPFLAQTRTPVSDVQFFIWTNWAEIYKSTHKLLWSIETRVRVRVCTGWKHKIFKYVIINLISSEKRQETSPRVWQKWHSQTKGHRRSFSEWSSQRKGISVFWEQMREVSSPLELEVEHSFLFILPFLKYLKCDENDWALSFKPSGPNSSMRLLMNESG